MLDASDRPGGRFRLWIDYAACQPLSWLGWAVGRLIGVAIGAGVEMGTAVGIGRGAGAAAGYATMEATRIAWITVIIWVFLC